MSQAEILYSESRPVGRDGGFYLMAAAAIVLGALIAGGIVIAALSRRTKDVVVMAVIGGFALYHGARLARLSARTTASDLVVRLDRRELVVALSDGPRVAFPRAKIRTISAAEYDPRAEAARLSGETMLAKLVLGTGLRVTNARRERGVRLELASGETRHLGLKDPEAFLRAYSKSGEAAR